MSDEINVVSRTQTIVVEPVSGSVSIINAGPQGPAGPGGGGGDSLWELTDIGEDPNAYRGDLHPVIPDNWAGDSGSYSFSITDNATIYIQPQGTVYIQPEDTIYIETDDTLYCTGGNGAYYGTDGGTTGTVYVTSVEDDLYLGVGDDSSLWVVSDSFEGGMRVAFGEAYTLADSMGPATIWWGDDETLGSVYVSSYRDNDFDFRGSYMSMWSSSDDNNGNGSIFIGSLIEYDNNTSGSFTISGRAETPDTNNIFVTLTGTKDIARNHTRWSDDDYTSEVDIICDISRAQLLIEGPELQAPGNTHQNSPLLWIQDGAFTDTLLITPNNTTITVAQNLNLHGIPTSNPGGSGRVWNDGGTLKIT